jgi:hypothetical protein
VSTIFEKCLQLMRVIAAFCGVIHEMARAWLQNCRRLVGRSVDNYDEKMLSSRRTGEGWLVFGRICWADSACHPNFENGGAINVDNYQTLLGDPDDNRLSGHPGGWQYGARYGCAGL